MAKNWPTRSKSSKTAPNNKWSFILYQFLFEWPIDQFYPSVKAWQGWGFQEVEQESEMEIVSQRFYMKDEHEEKD